MRFGSAQCKQKGTAALFVVLACFVAASLFIFFSFGLLNPLFSKTEEPLVKDQISPASKIPSEENVYSNRELGFKFGHARNFSIKEDTEELYNQRANGNFRKNFKGYVDYEPPQFLGAVSVLDESESFEKSPFTIWVFNNEQNLSKEKWFDLYWYYPFLWGVFDYTSKGHIAPDKEATISGQQAILKMVSYQPGSPQFIYVSKDQKMYLFKIIGGEGEKILAGFKFSQ